MFVRKSYDVRARAQTWVLMLGYVHKDRMMSHFQVYTYKVPKNEIDIGIAEWTAAKISYDDGKILVTKTNMFHRAYAYYLNHHPRAQTCHTPRS